MTREEAIWYLTPIAESASLERYKEALSMAVAALREQEERESVWHDAKDNHPQNPGLYYGKKDDTDSMYLCQYRDGVWTLDAYPETRIHVIKWAYYNAFVQEHEERENPKPLTLEELRQTHNPVWCSCELLDGGNGFWCLCINGKIIAPSGDSFDVEEIPNWVFLRNKPKEDA